MPSSGDLRSGNRPPKGTGEALLEIQNLRVHFRTERGIVRAVDGIDLQIRPNRTLGVVGESGCGKSVMALAILGLLPGNSAQVSGSILLHGRDGRVVDLTRLNPTGREVRRIRGAEIAMIFQEPMTSLNPVFTIGDQIAEVIRLHQTVDSKEAVERTKDMIALVGIPSPDQRMKDYPYQLSGGMRQRAMIAMAMSCNPAVLIADEPTTALDVTIQAQILDLMAKLQEETNTAIVMITHDLGVVAAMADEVAVMYLGQIVEYGSVRSVLKRRHHPYTRGLFRSIPVLGSQGKTKLEPIEGVVPDPRFIGEGCRFGDRCPERMQICDQEPPVFAPTPSSLSRCWLHDPKATAGG
jgi:oligopeptide/dipeptide ABC transporter ATP-binding protein